MIVQKTFIDYYSIMVKIQKKKEKRILTPQEISIKLIVMMQVDSEPEQFLPLSY